MSRKRKKQHSNPAAVKPEKVKCSHPDNKQTILMFGMYCNECQSLKPHPKKVREMMQKLKEEQENG